ncbi:MAG: hypothetical protein RRA35_06940, partial [Desulfomonilia bacterium]|nr:hypothetical protein [Desulfomonilia bacterium]
LGEETPRKKEEALIPIHYGDHPRADMRAPRTSAFAKTCWFLCRLDKSGLVLYPEKAFLAYCNEYESPTA